MDGGLDEDEASTEDPTKHRTDGVRRSLSLFGRMNHFDASILSCSFLASRHHLIRDILAGHANPLQQPYFPARICEPSMPSIPSSRCRAESSIGRKARNPSTVKKGSPRLREAGNGRQARSQSRRGQFLFLLGLGLLFTCADPESNIPFAITFWVKIKRRRGTSSRRPSTHRRP
jgi:hypothetical protein